MRLLLFLLGSVYPEAAQCPKKSPGTCFVDEFPGHFQQNTVLKASAIVDSKKNLQVALLTRRINPRNNAIKKIPKVTFETDAAHNRVFVYTGVPNKNAMNIAEAQNVDFSNTITTFEVKISKCESGKCTISVELNGERLTFKPEPNKETEFDENFYVPYDQLQALYHFGRCQITDGLIDSCQIVLRSNTLLERRYRGLSYKNCGRTYKLTDAQKNSLPTKLLNFININGIKKHLEQCVAWRYGEKLASDRIIGGVDASPNMEPWLVSFRKGSTKRSNEDIHSCGGSLISKCWVLTAAHCFKNDNIDGSYFNIKIGQYFNMAGSEYRLDVQEEQKKYAKVEHIHDSGVKKVILHPQYEKNRLGGHDYDIALVELDNCVPEYSQFVQPVCLPYNPTQFQQGCGIISGWGKTEKDQELFELPNRLQVTSISMLPDEKCKEDYGNKYRKGSSFCAGNSDKTAEHRDTCQGDSGGPFTLTDKSPHKNRPDRSYQKAKEGGYQLHDRTSRSYLVGITSFGSKNCDKVGIYTDVSSNIEWMYRALKKEPSFTQKLDTPSV